MIVCRARVGGNGFGNEFLYVAKALVASLDLKLPIWKPHWRGAYVDLPASINETSFARHRLRYVRFRPTHRMLSFGRREYEDSGKVSISEALLHYLEQQGIPLSANYVVSFPGLFPDISSVVHRSQWLRSLLLADRQIALGVAGNLAKLPTRKLWVGVHIRRGDFGPALPLGERWPSGEWNIRIPLEWYSRVCRTLQSAYPDRIAFFLASNGRDQELAEFKREFGCVTGRVSNHRECSDVVDMLTLSSCDIHVASPSWFGYWAMAFSGKPYIWYDCAHSPNFRSPKGCADPGTFFSSECGEIPDPLLAYVDQTIGARKVLPRAGLTV